MNVTELARRLKITTKELLEILPEVGFDIGRRAIKIDDRQAHRIIQQWPVLKSRYDELHAPETDPALADVSPEQVQIKTISLPSSIRVRDFAQKLQLPLPKVMAELMKNGVLSSMNEKIDYDTAAIIGSELGFEVSPDATTQQDSTEDETTKKLESVLSEERKKNAKPRPPVVVVMGHVDHGKTKLLDTIRQTNVVAGESGGITQHIGAYQAEKKGKLITFIDTPGHEAFTTMRSRGARVADIAVLVVAADDSIQPQTKESIKIIKSAGLPMVVAINKIDKEAANIEKVKQDLASENLLPEDWGGKTITVPISAKQGIGIDNLLEMILLVADTESDNIQANPDASAIGTIVEAHVDPGQGPVATVLIQNGTLKRGDQVEVSQMYYGKIRAMKDFTGADVDAAGPSMPVKILGLKVAPSVGDVLQVSTSVERRAKVDKYRLNQQATDYTTPQETPKESAEGISQLNLVLKADVLGSLEAILASLSEISHPEISLNIVARGLGNITEGDIERAETSNAIVLGFHVQLTTAAEKLAKTRGVEIHLYGVIYKLLEEIRSRVELMLSPEIIRTELGKLDVLAVFNKQEKSLIAGGKVSEGKMVLGALAEIHRANRLVAKGKITQLQSNKVDVNEVNKGTECGVKFEGKPVVQAGDILLAYTEETKEKKLA